MHIKIYKKTYFCFYLIIGGGGFNLKRIYSVITEKFNDTENNISFFRPPSPLMIILYTINKLSVRWYIRGVLYLIAHTRSKIKIESYCVFKYDQRSFKKK